MYQQINPVAETEEETGVMLFPVTQSLETYTQSTLFESLPIRERPGTRISELGPQACTDYELLATVIGGKYQIEVAQSLISKYGDLYKIYNAHTSVLAREIKGLTEATAIKLKAALAIGLRMAKNPTVEKPAINSPSDAAAIVQYEMGGLTAEELWVMCLDRRNRILEIRHLYKGSVSSSQVRIGEIFELPIQIKASAIICMHNHPSGDPTPSPDDVALTRAIVQAGKLLDVDLLDHLVISQGRWISLKERGLTPPLREWLQSGRPYLGICLGYQILFESSEESPDAEGLGYWPGRVVRFPSSPQRKVPHMGWNSLTWEKPDEIFAGLPAQPYVFFVHSYYPSPQNRGIVTARCNYGTDFAAAAAEGHVHGVQFHPEKSQSTGLRILGNFVGSLRAKN